MDPKARATCALLKPLLLVSRPPLADVILSKGSGVTARIVGCTPALGRKAVRRLPRDGRRSVVMPGGSGDSGSVGSNVIGVIGFDGRSGRGGGRSARCSRGVFA